MLKSLRQGEPLKKYGLPRPTCVPFSWGILPSQPSSPQADCHPFVQEGYLIIIIIILVVIVVVNDYCKNKNKFFICGNTELQI